jgi:transposase InsO family protein
MIWLLKPDHAGATECAPAIARSRPSAGWRTCPARPRSSAWRRRWSICSATASPRCPAASGVRVARELDRIVARRGWPGAIVSDNGTELASNAILAWSDRHKVAWHYIAPGKPAQNAFIESFNGRPRRSLHAPAGPRRGAVDRRKIADSGARPHPTRAADQARPVRYHDPRL